MVPNELKIFFTRADMESIGEKMLRILHQSVRVRTRRLIMGMSASQARMLSLTSRMSDLELQAQSISNSKIRLADQAEEASRAYSNALDKEKMTVYSGLSGGTSSYMDANALNLTTYQGVSDTDKQRFIKDGAGKVLVNATVGTAYNANVNNLNGFLTAMNCGTDTGKISYYTNVFNEIKDSGGFNQQSNENMTSSEWLQDQIHMGNVFLYTYNNTAGADGKGDFVNVSWTSGDASLQEKTDSTDTAKAEAEYETTMASIQSKDKRFDLQLKQIDTEHSAIQTEIDSVKKVIDKNIERSFKTFNG